MTVQKRNLFGDVAPQGTSFDPDGPSQVVPATGQVNQQYRPPAQAQRQDSSYGLDSELSRDRGEVDAYKRARARHSGISWDDDSNETSCGVELDANDSDDFRTTGRVDGEEFGTTTGGTDQLVQRAAGGDTGEEFGKAVL
jgi:hypothetical protein